MNPCVAKVTANDNYTLTLVFTNQEVKSIDVKSYLDKGIFQELKDVSFFKTVSVSMGTIQWQNWKYFCIDTLYIKSLQLEKLPT